MPQSNERIENRKKKKTKQPKRQIEHAKSAKRKFVVGHTVPVFLPFQLRVAFPAVNSGARVQKKRKEKKEDQNQTA